jgi:outer membrane protein assembly factor BamD (BamD/ComL family)
MSRLRTLLVLPLLVAAACASQKKDQSEVLPSEMPGTEARRMFAEASGAFNEKRYDDAADLFEEVHETWPSSLLAPEAKFWQAESLYWDGDLVGAYEALKKFLEVHSLYGRVDRVERRLWELGSRLIQEGKGGLLGMGLLKTSERGVVTLNYLVEEFPNGHYADDALMEIGRYHRWDGDLPAAIATFQDLLERYPRSAWRFEAQLLLAASYRQINRGAPYDPGTLAKAKEEYQRYIRMVEQDPTRAAEYTARLDLARQRIREIDETLGENELLAARWYLHLEEDEAAAFYLTRTASIYADTEAGREAADLLRGMGREVPDPGRETEPAGEGRAPAPGS